MVQIVPFLGFEEADYSGLIPIGIRLSHGADIDRDEPEESDMHRTQFCTARETIMIKLATSTGFYFEEGERHGKTYDNLRHCVTRLTMDNAAAYLRFDLDTLSAEDVTEEFAAEWLQTFKGSPEDEDQLPIYVRTSQAWDAWCEAYTVENGLAFTRGGHGTLNHRQQFGR